MEKLGETLRQQAGNFVIVHADLHPGNLIRNRITNQVFIIDWEEVMLAPKERDFLFVKDSTASANTGQPETSPFFQGYTEEKEMPENPKASAEVDWVALTYYRCERVIQDLIECARVVFRSPDLEEETKAEQVQLFLDILAESGEASSAFAAATHLPANLIFYKDN